MKNWRPDNWDKIKPRPDVNPDDSELKRDRVLAYNCGYEWGVEAGADALLKEIAIELQAIYGDLGTSDRRMGEFIQELMEEAK